MNHSAIANIRQVHMAFQILASHSHQGSENPKDPVGAFLSHHILGFMARFGDVVNDFQIQYSVIEKIRCLKGVEEMIKIGKKVIRVARPQVCFEPFISLYHLTSRHRSVPFCSKQWLERSFSLPRFLRGTECSITSKTTMLR